MQFVFPAVKPTALPYLSIFTVYIALRGSYGVPMNRSRNTKSSLYSYPFKDFISNSKLGFTAHISVSINHVRNKRCAIEVFKCLNGLAPKVFENHCKRFNHEKETRGNKSSLVVPRIRITG